MPDSLRPDDQHTQHQHPQPQQPHPPLPRTGRSEVERSGPERSLPERPSLRYLKLEAKRRVADGEFGSLHEAQLAIAREHGLAGWAALKQAVGEPDGPALAQLRWVLGRFRGAGSDGWVLPDEAEMREHFADVVFQEVPPAVLAASIAEMGPQIQAEHIVPDHQERLAASVRMGGVRILARVTEEAPHRLTGIGVDLVAKPSADPRVADPPPPHTVGVAPEAAVAATRWGLTELGLAGLVVAGGRTGGAAWIVADGWADLERGELLRPEHRFPAHGLAALVTATAVLRLVGEGRFGLDTPANERLLTVRLADDSVTVRELLSHTAGVHDPALDRLFGDRVSELAAIAGPVIACDGPRGVIRPSNGACAVLGQLVADVTGLPYVAAVTGLVLGPLGLDAGVFPERADRLGTGVVTGYDLTEANTFAAVPPQVCTLPAVSGLWASAAEVLRLAAGWATLLPPELAREAVTPRPGVGLGGPTGAVGLGWFVTPDGTVATIGGAAPGGAAALFVRPGDGGMCLAMTSRVAPLDGVVQRAAGEGQA